MSFLVILTKNNYRGSQVKKQDLVMSRHQSLGVKEGGQGTDKLKESGGNMRSIFNIRASTLNIDPIEKSEGFLKLYISRSVTKSHEDSVIMYGMSYQIYIETVKAELPSLPIYLEYHDKGKKSFQGVAFNVKILRGSVCVKRTVQLQARSLVSVVLEYQDKEETGRVKKAAFGQIHPTS